MKKREGVCLFCSRKENCTYIKTEGGPIECDEYEEVKSEKKDKCQKIEVGKWVVVEN